MERVDGPTLAERLSSGATPMDEAESVALQIAQALEAAHEKAVTHRDLKPGNIQITLGGAVKVLDLAKVGHTPTPEVGDESPTLTLRAGLNQFHNAPSTDGQRFLIVSATDDGAPTLNLVTNWQRLLATPGAASR
jgi:serine/threonine protein kinase